MMMIFKGFFLYFSSKYAVFVLSKIELHKIRIFNSSLGKASELIEVLTGDVSTISRGRHIVALSETARQGMEETGDNFFEANDISR